MGNNRFLTNFIPPLIAFLISNYNFSRTSTRILIYIVVVEADITVTLIFAF